MTVYGDVDVTLIVIAFVLFGVLPAVCIGKLARRGVLKVPQGGNDLHDLRALRWCAIGLAGCSLVPTVGWLVAAPWLISACDKSGIYCEEEEVVQLVVIFVAVAWGMSLSLLAWLRRDCWPAAASLLYISLFGPMAWYSLWAATTRYWSLAQSVLWIASGIFDAGAACLAGYLGIAWWHHRRLGA